MTISEKLYGLIHDINRRNDERIAMHNIEVRDFVTFLRAKYIRKPTKPLRQDWAGGLSQYRHQLYNYKDYL